MYVDEQTVECNVYPSQTVSDIKKIFQVGDDGIKETALSRDGIQNRKAKGGLTRRYKVFHNEKELEDHMTLLDNGVNDGETLYLKRMLKLLITIVKTPQEGIHISQLCRWQ